MDNRKTGTDMNTRIRWTMSGEGFPQDHGSVLAVIDGNRGIKEWVEAPAIACYGPSTGWMLEDLILDNFKVLAWAQIPGYGEDENEGWTLIEDSAPATGDSVLVIFNGKKGDILYEEEPGIAAFDDSGWWLDGVDMDEFRILAWMEIPDYKKGKKR